MSAHAQFEYPPPRSWEQFEELCADTFAAEWTDPALVRHGRAGQRQHGVDIVARHGARWPIGLQCKKKSRWPVKRLTTQEIDQEVMKARKFRAKLQSFYILTTAPDDTAIQKHVREINEKHASSGLFNVEVLGWSEIVRRATLHAAVARKHFGGSSNEPPSPLLAVLFASQHLLELKGMDLSLTCRELAHDLRATPTGRLVLRQRESDDLAEQIAAYEGRALTLKQRSQRLELRDLLKRSARALPDGRHCAPGLSSRGWGQCWRQSNVAIERLTK
jgi:hypothetical protein